MFWTDELIEDILKKREADSYLITDWKTPSGHVHIGALRGVVIHGIVQEGLAEAEKSAVFQYGFDDYDPMDGLPIYIDPSFKEHMGKPLNTVPAPDGKSASFAAQYANDFIAVIKKLGFEPKIVWTSELYKSGKFNDAIKIILDHASQIREIYKEVSGSDKGEKWYPLNVVCPNCGKVGTTRVTGWDGKVVEFECTKDLVDWAEGCGNKGEISPFDGNGKLPWKVEWPSKWSTFNSSIEGEGKDHAAASGSREVADRIYREIFKKQPPYDIPYEHFTFGGAKMSSSKGLGASAAAMAELLPGNILKFLFVRTRSKRVIEFNPEGDTIPLLYDEYDRCAKIFNEDPNQDLARPFYYTETNLEKELPQYLMRFSKIANFLQMPKVDILKYAKEEKGADLTVPEKDEIERRIETAKKWLADYAPESVKFSIQEKLPNAAKSLSQVQKEFLTKIAEAISEKEKWNGEDLHAKIHEIKNEMEINPKEAFSAVYSVILSKDSGPQAGWLLASLDQDFVTKRLKLSN